MATERTQIDDLLATLLATGLTYAEAAEKANTSENTVYRRMKSPRFRERVQAARARIVEAVTGRLIDRMAAAADALADLLKDPDPKNRLSAARSILGLGREFWSGVDQQVIMDKLNELLRESKSHEA
jgi:hypothetical protein